MATQTIDTTYSQLAAVNIGSQLVVGWSAEVHGGAAGSAVGVGDDPVGEAEQGVSGQQAPGGSRHRPPLTVLIGSPRLCSPKFLTCEQGSM